VRATDLAQRLRALEDQTAIGQLVARYGPAADSGDGDAVARLWTDDGTYEAPPHGVWTGHDEIAGMIDGSGHQTAITGGAAHVLTAPVITVDGDEARAWNYALHLRWDPEQHRFWVFRLSANTWHLRRQPDGWRVVRRVNRNLDGAPEARAILQASVVE